jgi:hypothetical protein
MSSSKAAENRSAPVKLRKSTDPHPTATMITTALLFRDHETQEGLAQTFLFPNDDTHGRIDFSLH